MRSEKRVVLLLLSAVVFSLACNLTTIQPTATLGPDQPTPTFLAAPTLFASITPLPGGVVPTPPPSNCQPPQGWVQYTIETGDTLAALADATNTTVQTLVQANCLTNPDTLYTGQVIYLPSSPISG